MESIFPRGRSSAALETGSLADDTLLRQILKSDCTPLAAGPDGSGELSEVRTEAKENGPRINEHMDNEELITRLWLQEDGWIPVNTLKWEPTRCFGGSPGNEAGDKNKCNPAKGVITKSVCETEFFVSRIICQAVLCT